MLNIFTPLTKIKSALLNANFNYIESRLGTTGSASPEGVAAAPVGAMYVDTTNRLLYIKLNGSGNTGWSTISGGGGLKIVTEYGAKGDGVTDDTEAIQRAVDATGSGTLFFPLGVYIVTKEIMLYYQGMRCLGESMGGGLGILIGGTSDKEYTNGSTIQAKGDWVGYVKTRRKYQGSSTDPGDDPCSAVFNIEHNGITIENMVFRNEYDFSDKSINNIGRAVDYGVFVGCRNRVRVKNCAFIGFRKEGVYFDLTRTMEDHGGVAQGGTSTTITLASSYTGDAMNEQIVIEQGTGKGQERTVTAYNSTTKVATVTPSWNTLPNSTSNYELRGQEWSTPADRSTDINGADVAKPNFKFPYTPERGIDCSGVIDSLFAHNSDWCYVIAGGKPKAGLDYAGSVYAFGATVTFNSVPLEGDTITLAGTKFTFVDIVQSPFEVELADTIVDTIDHFVQAFDTVVGGELASGLINESDCTLLLGTDQLRIYSREATVISGYTLDKVSDALTLSSSTLVSSADPAPIWNPTTQKMERSRRGSTGASDFEHQNNHVYAIHVSGRQRKPMPFNNTADYDYLTEVGGCVLIDGGESPIQGQSFLGSGRIQTYEVCGIRVQTGNRIVISDRMQFETPGVITRYGLDRSKVYTGTAQAGTSSTITLASNSPTAFVDAALNNWTVQITGGTGALETRKIQSWNATTKVATVSPAFTIAPASNTTYRLFLLKDDYIEGGISWRPRQSRTFPFLNYLPIRLSAVHCKVGKSKFWCDLNNVATGISRTGQDCEFYGNVRIGQDLTGLDSNRLNFYAGGVGGNFRVSFRTNDYTFGEIRGQTALTRDGDHQIRISTGGALGRGFYTAISFLETFANKTAYMNMFARRPHFGTAQDGTPTTITLATTASAVDDVYVGHYVVIDGGTADGRVSEITDYNGTTKVATLIDSGVAPDSTSTYDIKSPLVVQLQGATNRIQARDNTLDLEGNNGVKFMQAGVTLGTVSSTGLVLDVPLTVQGATPVTAIESTFTPSLDFITLPTFTVQQGHRRTSGKLTTFFIDITVSGLDTTDGSPFTLSGFPFSPVFPTDIVQADIDFSKSTLLTGATVPSINIQTQTGGGSRLFLCDSSGSVNYNSGKVNTSGRLKAIITLYRP